MRALRSGGVRPSRGARGCIWWSLSVPRGRGLQPLPQGPVFPSQGGQRTLVTPPTQAWGGQLAALEARPTSPPPLSVRWPQDPPLGHKSGALRGQESVMHPVGLWSQKRKPASTSRLCHTRPCHITLETCLVSSSINLPDRVVLRTRYKVKKEASVTPASGKLRMHCSPNSDTGTYGRACWTLSAVPPRGTAGAHRQAPLLSGPRTPWPPPQHTTVGPARGHLQGTRNADKREEKHLIRTLAWKKMKLKIMKVFYLTLWSF